MYNLPLVHRPPPSSYSKQRMEAYLFSYILSHLSIFSSHCFCLEIKDNHGISLLLNFANYQASAWIDQIFINLINFNLGIVLLLIRVTKPK